MPEDKNGPMKDGWEQWSRHVLAELKRLNGSVEKIQTELTRVKVEVGTLQVKSGIWGAMGASVPVVIGLLIWLVTRS